MQVSFRPTANDLSTGLTEQQRRDVERAARETNQSVTVLQRATTDLLHSIVDIIDDRDHDDKVTRDGRPTKRSVPRIQINVVNDHAGQHAPAPAWTNGQDIFVASSTFRSSNELVRTLAYEAHLGGPSIPKPESLIDFAVLKGATYHELSHILYSPRLDSRAGVLLRGDGSVPKQRRAWNLLEDGRIESLFVQSYPGGRAYFTSTVIRIVLGAIGEDGHIPPKAHLWTYGRRYLPTSIRQRARDLYIAVYGLSAAQRAEALIDEFIDTPQSVHSFNGHTANAALDRLRDVVVEFANLIDENDGLDGEGGGTPGEGGEIDPDGHDEGHGEQTGGKPVRTTEPGEPGEPLSDEPAEPSGNADADDADADADAGADADGDADGDGDGNGEANSDGGDGGDDSDSRVRTGNSGPSGVDGWRDGIDQDLQKELERVLEAADEAVEVDAGKLRDSAVAAANGQTVLGDFHSRLYDASPEAHQIQRQIAATFARLDSDLRASHERRTKRGRVNGRRYERTQNPDTAYDRFHPSREGAAKCDVVLLVDFSGSIGGAASAISQAAWAVKRAVDEQNVGDCHVLAFDHKVGWLYRPGERANRHSIKTVGANGGTSPRRGFDEALRILGQSTRKNRLILVLTDGEWNDAQECRDVISEANARGIHTVGVYFAAAGKRAFLDPVIDEEARASGLTPRQRVKARDEAYEAWADQAVATSGSTEYEYGVASDTDYGSSVAKRSRPVCGLGKRNLGLVFTAYSARGFAQITERVVENIRHVAAYGVPTRWVEAQRRQAGQASK